VRGRDKKIYFCAGRGKLVLRLPWEQRREKGKNGGEKKGNKHSDVYPKLLAVLFLKGGERCFQPPMKKRTFPNERKEGPIGKKKTLPSLPRPTSLKT